jgi:hypothetical protein
MERFRPQPDQPQPSRDAGKDALGFPINQKKGSQRHIESPEGRHEDNFLSPEEEITFRLVQQHMSSVEIPIDKGAEEKVIARMRAIDLKVARRSTRNEPTNGNNA